MNWVRQNVAYVILVLVAILLIFFAVRLQALLMDMQPARLPVQLGEAITPTPFLTPALLQPTVLPAIPTTTILNPTTESTISAVTAAVPGNTAQAQPAANQEPALSPEERLEIDILGATNLTTSEEDAILVDIIKNNPYAVGFIRYSSYVANKESLRALPIQLGKDAMSIEPNENTVASGAYPFARPLLLYASASEIRAKPQLEAYIGCYLNHLFNEIESVGYTPPSLAMYRDAIDSFKASCQRCQMSSSSNPFFPQIPACTVENVAPGSLDITGGSTVYPLSGRMIDLFKGAGFSGAIKIEDIGTSAGFERFCENGEADIVNASRLVRAKEIDACQAINRDLIAFPVGLDLVVVVVSRLNQFIQEVSFDQLHQIFTSAIRWHELGPAWPAESIIRAIPNKSRGTFAFFVETLYAGISSSLTVAAPIAVAPSATPSAQSTSTQPITAPTATEPLPTSTVLRLGYLENDENCTLITTIVQSILEQKLNVNSELLAFKTADALFAALATSDAQSGIDWTMCYVDPDDRDFLTQYGGAITIIGKSYWQHERKRYLIMSQGRARDALQQNEPCVYLFLRNFRLDEQDLTGQNAASWLEMHQDVVDVWVRCE